MTASITLLAEVRELAATGEARRRRQAARVSLREMAADLDVSHTTLLAWEEGRSVPRAAAALRWHAALADLAPVAS